MGPPCSCDGCRGQAGVIPVGARCHGCGYPLAGLMRSGATVTCPECGAEQVPREPPVSPPWPRPHRVLLSLSGVTFALCTLCAVTLMALPGLTLIVALPALLSGPLVPLFVAPTLALRYETVRTRRFLWVSVLLLIGWGANLVIGGAFLGLAGVIIEAMWGGLID